MVLGDRQDGFPRFFNRTIKTFYPELANTLGLLVCMQALPLSYYII